jgi:hypothetical protein
LIRLSNEILVVLSPEVNLLFPFIILANDKRVDLVLDAPVHDKPTHFVQRFIFTRYTRMAEPVEV